MSERDFETFVEGYAEAMLWANCYAQSAEVQL